MKRIISLAILLLIVEGLYAQSFSTSLFPASHAIVQGSSSESSFSIQVNVSGGFSSSVYLELIVPDQLAGAVSVSAGTLNVPYSGGRVLVSDSRAIGPGTHHIVVKSHNGPITELDTIFFTVLPSSCPEWFAYNSVNAPFKMHQVEAVAIDANNNFWIGSPGDSFGEGGSLICFDRQNWHVWQSTGLTVYDLTWQVVSTSTQQINLEGVSYIRCARDTVYAIGTTHVYQVVNKQLIDFPAPPVTADLKKVQLDNSGALWISTNTQLFKHTSSGWTNVQLTNAPFDPTVTIRSFEIDHQGNIWLAQQGSVHRFDGTFWTTYTGHAAHAIRCGPDGEMYCITDNSVLRVDQAASSFIILFQYKNLLAYYYEGLSFYNGYPVVSGPSGVFVLNSGSPTHYYDHNSPVTQGNLYPRCAVLDNQGNMLIADGEQLVYRCVNLPTGLAENEVTGMVHAYPNPTSGQVTIEVGFSMDTKTWRLPAHDVLGREFMVNAQVSEGQIIADLGSLPVGVYILKMQALDGTMQSVKLIRN